MRIFPLTFMSNYDRLKSFMKIIHNVSVKAPVIKNNPSSDVVTLSGENSLKKGRSICDMLSE